MTFFHNIHHFQEKAFDYVFYFSYLLYFLFAIGFANNAPEYLVPLEFYTKIYVSLFLILRFNPFRNVNFTELDKKIAFNAGIFIITATLLNKSLYYYFLHAKTLIQERL
jgi:hypothetical protein